mmetsp:Transcript_19042/g.25841  ORF Transcript_19042/g.25841 Transcript_19042/m.25841 type:complete len:260 (-) Transcript_19042:689-1468(-)
MSLLFQAPSQPIHPLVKSRPQPPNPGDLFLEYLTVLLVQAASLEINTLSLSEQIPSLLPAQRDLLFHGHQPLLLACQVLGFAGMVRDPPVKGPQRISLRTSHLHSLQPLLQRFHRAFTHIHRPHHEVVVVLPGPNPSFAFLEVGQLPCVHEVKLVIRGSHPRHLSVRLRLLGLVHRGWEHVRVSRQKPEVGSVGSAGGKLLKLTQGNLLFDRPGCILPPEPLHRDTPVGIQSFRTLHDLFGVHLLDGRKPRVGPQRAKR